ncbi:unnamed protein product [Caretta caretta]
MGPVGLGICEIRPVPQTPTVCRMDGANGGSPGNGRETGTSARESVAAHVPDAGDALAALHTIKRGISIDGASISPETTQRVTSASPDACPASETTQRDPRTLPDARPAGPLNPTRPHQDKPATDTADAAGTPPLQGNEDTVYLQYPLTADVLICPICSPSRSFHLLGGVTRHLKRCHSKQVAFSCALCSLPFETQKQCKTHQVTCRKRLKGTTQSPAPAPIPPAARRPAAPGSQPRKATLQAAIKKPAPVARPAQRDAVIEKKDQHPAVHSCSRSCRRKNQRHPWAALRTPTAGRARAAPQTALQAPAARGASATPQIALQTPDVAGGTSPAATAKHRAFIARRPSTAPESILRDTAYGRSHSPAATAQTAATPRRISGVPATPEPDCVSPTTSNASIPPEIPPQRPIEGNPDPRDRRQADPAGFEPALDEVEDHEGQQPMVRAATPWQTAWTEELQAAASFDDFDLLLDRLTQELSAETAPRRSLNQENAPPAHRKPAPDHNTTTRGARSRDASRRYDPAAASRIQKLGKPLQGHEGDPRRALALLHDPI